MRRKRIRSKYDLTNPALLIFIIERKYHDIKSDDYLVIQPVISRVYTLYNQKIRLINK